MFHIANLGDLLSFLGLEWPGVPWSGLSAAMICGLSTEFWLFLNTFRRADNEYFADNEPAQNVARVLKYLFQGRLKLKSQAVYAKRHCYISDGKARWGVGVC